MDNSKVIKEKYQKDIDKRIGEQIEVFKVQAKELHDAKDRYLAEHSRLNKFKGELKGITNIGEKDSLDVTAYRYKIERDIDRQEEKLKASKRLVDAYEKRLKDLVKKHKEEIKVKRQELFNALEEERARIKREKEIIGD